MKLQIAAIACGLVFLLALFGVAATVQAASKAPRLTGVRCVPVAAKGVRDRAGRRAEARAGAASIAAGADRFVIEAETKYEGRYASAQRYMSTLRAAIGPNHPLGFTSFPYVDYHPHVRSGRLVHRPGA